MQHDVANVIDTQHCYPRPMKQTSFGFLISCLVLMLGCTQPTSSSPAAKPEAEPTSSASLSAPRTTTSARFDFYLLNLSWSPEFCHSHPTAKECAQHAAFVLHGLWPERTDGTYPENCSNAPGPSDPGNYADIYPDAGLLKHEWRTHGTCSGLSADTFFSDARSAYRNIIIPAKLLQLTSQLSLPPGQISALFQQNNPHLPSSSIVISCGNNYLTAVEVCLDKNLHATACGAVKSCRANSVRIPNP